VELGDSMNFKGMKTLVCGIARSGVAAANLLCDEGAIVSISDIKPMDKLKEEISNIKYDITIITGKNPDLDDTVLKQDMLVLSPGIPTGLAYIEKAKSAGIPVIGEFELASRFCKAQILAITGTNGKTTTTSMLYEIMKAHNPLSEVVGNIGTAFSERVKNINEKAFCVAEVSSFQLESIERFKPKVSAILNFSEDHLDRHGSFRNYVNVKARIFENQDESDFLVLNYDDIECKELTKRAKAKVLYFSRKDFNINGVFLKGDTFYLNINGEAKYLLKTADLTVTGTHNYENAMAAIAMAHVMNVPVEIIVASIKKFAGVAHRMEYVRTLNGVVYYNDSKGTNIESAIKAIEAIDKPIFLIGGGCDKGADFSLWVKSFESKVKKLYIIGAVSDILEEACQKQGFYNYEKIKTFEEAVKKASTETKSGEVVLLSPACASWDMFESYEHRGDLFKKIVNELK